jgi:hypothetical protein
VTARLREQHGAWRFAYDPVRSPTEQSPSRTRGLAADDHEVEAIDQQIVE